MFMLEKRNQGRVHCPQKQGNAIFMSYMGENHGNPKPTTSKYEERW
jgi:hypothetical protein